jgi:hypothetical protein
VACAARSRMQVNLPGIVDLVHIDAQTLAHPSWHAKGHLDGGRRHHDRVSSAVASFVHPPQQLAAKNVNIKAKLRRPPFGLRLQVLP